MSKIPIARHCTLLAMLTSLLCLAACSPQYNWREVRGKDAHFVVLLPDKPTTLTRDINLDGTTLAMTMTAAEVDGVSFVVGYVDLPDSARVPAALNAMKTALIGNIHGKIKTAATADRSSAAIDVEASGHGNDSNDALLLLGHFEAKGNRAYQVIVLGNEKNVMRDEAKTFFSSFKAN